MESRQDPRNKSPQRCIVAGGQNTTDGDIISKNVSFYILKNAISDRRAGVVQKRPGSTAIDLGDTYGIPLGMYSRVVDAVGDLIPQSTELFINLGGGAAGYWDGSTFTELTIDSNCDFSISKPNSFSQIGGTLFIAGGLPAKWAEDPGTHVERVGIPAPAANITHARSGTGISATQGGYRYMYTYYNSSTGLESDWSPVSTATGNFVDDQVDLTIPTTAASAYDVDQKRIYRTFDGGSVYYLLTTVAVATATYADTTTDATLSANAIAAPSGSRGLPPDEAYITAAFNGRIFWAEGHNLYFSQAYDGTPHSLEYYPEENIIRADAPITGLHPTSGRLLVFHNRSIEQLTGYDESDFSFAPFLNGTGTLFHNSISSNGRELIFFSEEGWEDIGSGARRRISWPIQSEIDEWAGYPYNSDLYIASCWNPQLKQFIILHAAVSSDSAPWVNDVGLFAEWEDAGSGDTAEWEDDGGGSAQINRNILYGWSPEFSSAEEERWHEYVFAQFEDLAEAGQIVSCLYHPPPGSQLLSPQQQETYLGFYDGTEAGVLAAFDRSASTDDGETITSTILTRRIDVGVPDGKYRRFRHLQFCGTHADPLRDGDATLQYMRDLEDPHIQGFLADLEEFANTDRDKKAFEYGKARWIHLYMVDTASSANKILLEDFYVHFNQTHKREGR